MSSRHSFCSIRGRGVVSGRSRRPLRSRAGLSARPSARNTPVTSSDDIVPALATAAPLDSSPAAQTGRASMPRSVQVSNELALSDNFSGPSHGSDDHSLSLLLNDTKKKLAECRGELRDAKDEKKVLLDHIRSLEAENRSLRSERDGLKSVLEENMSGVVKKRKKVDVLSTIDARYVGVASQVLSALPKLCAKETMELEPFATKPSRRWVRRGDVVENLGVEAAPGILVAPYPGDTLTSVAKYFTPSFETEQEFLALAVAEELKKEAWQQVFFTTDEKKRCVEILSGCRELRSKQRQLLSDELSSRKRKARDMLFTSLGFHSLQSRFVAQSEEQKASKLLEVSIAKSNLLRYSSNGDLIFGTWRAASASSLCKEGSALSGIHEDIVAPEENLCFFKSRLAVRVLHEYMGLDATSGDQHNTDGSLISGTILVLARLDAFIATAVASLREDGKDSVGGHRQKVYQETFRSYLPKAFQQIVGQVCTFVQNWCPDELDLSFLSLSKSSTELLETARDATVEVFVPSLQRRLVAVSYKWFNRYVTSYLGNIHDCYIAEYNPDLKAIVMLGSSLHDENAQLDNSSLGMDAMGGVQI